MHVWGKDVSDRGNGMCKGLVVGACPERSRKNKNRCDYHRGEQGGEQPELRLCRAVWAMQ